MTLIMYVCSIQAAVNSLSYLRINKVTRKDIDGNVKKTGKEIRGRNGPPELSHTLRNMLKLKANLFTVISCNSEVINYLLSIDYLSTCRAGLIS